jgi:hypothetical protein
MKKLLVMALAAGFCFVGTNAFACPCQDKADAAAPVAQADDAKAPGCAKAKDGDCKCAKDAGCAKEADSAKKDGAACNCAKDGAACNCTKASAGCGCAKAAG